ncbi:MAG: multi-sensor signal transduction histidine kinase [Candidatus Saccharibacteria bacterium]|nr:multi-sensor signal transduction histidine kinase [Candidatus Saccharibacteria bacterium]
MTDNELRDVLNASFKDLKVGIHIYQLQDISDDKSLRIVYANEHSQTLIGQKIDEMVGKTIDECFPSIRSKGVPEKYALVALGGDAIELEDVSYEDSHIQGALAINAYSLPHTCVCVMFANITARAQTQDDIKKRNDELTALNEIMVNRELKMIELKDQINKLKMQLK